MSGWLSGYAIPFMAHSRGCSSPTPNGNGDIGVDARVNREHGVMPKPISKLPV
jgi:hypothetical protein